MGTTNKNYLKYVIMALMGLSIISIVIGLITFIFHLESNKILLAISLFPLLAIPEAILITMLLYKPKKKKARSFNDKLHQTLGIDFIKSYKTKKLPKWIGGFMIPAFPFFNVINMRWKRKKQFSAKVAKIHEAVHTYLLLKRGYLIWIVFIPSVIATLSIALLEYIFKIVIPFYSWISLAIIVPLMVISLTLNEYKTFQYTNKISRCFKLKQYKFTKRHLKFYLLFYFIQLSILSIVIKTIIYIIQSIMEIV